MFQIKARGSTFGREVLGGVTIFMAMSYIIFVQVGVLGAEKVGMDKGGVFMATCLAAAAASILMGLFANYPIALAPGMGENFFFASMLAPAMASSSASNQLPRSGSSGGALSKFSSASRTSSSGSSFSPDTLPRKLERPLIADRSRPNGGLRKAAAILV